LLHEISFVPFYEQITVDYPEGTTREIEMHDGSHLRLRKLEREYDPTNRLQAIRLLKESQGKGEFLTGLVYVNPEQKDLLSMLNLVNDPLATISLERTRPSRDAFDEIMAGLG
jgi:2-oxoglutarate/2-oxoacid ferredoxin oxidoreductase subunit beta